jgi:ABC-type sugar transport system permease subunit
MVKVQYSSKEGKGMKRKTRSEMTKLLWSFTIPVLLLVALIVVAYLVYGIVTANNNAKHTKQFVISQNVKSFKSFGTNFQSLTGVSPELLKQFNPEIVRAAFSGDPVPLYSLAKNIMMLTSPSVYTAAIKDGKIVDSANTSGANIDQSKLPTSVPPSGYVMLNSFGGRGGQFLDLFTSVDLSKLGSNVKFTVSSIIDLTSQIKAIDKYFQDQKRDTVISLVIFGVIALVLFGLLSTFWLRYLINKFIRKPVHELNTMAQDIAAGTYQGEVVVDENSDFAALQGLLRSGQLILRKFDEKA